MKILILLLTIAGISACQPAATSDDSQLVIASMQQSGDDYAQVLPETRIEFPQDHGPHPAFRQEWWYLTANLKDEQGEPLGLQWTQFRVSLTPEVPAEAQPDWQTQQLFLGHAAVTSADQHLAAERWQRQHPQLAFVTAAPLTVALNNWRWQSDGETLLPASLSVSTEEFGYQLRLEGTSQIWLQGEDGFSQKHHSEPIASHYYSQPFIRVSGQVRFGDEIKTVTGEAWLDREWSSQFLGESQDGWDWFALKLSEDERLMLYQLRGENPYLYANIMYRDGTRKPLDSADIQMTPTGFFEADDSRYPSEWTIKSERYQIDLKVSAINPDSRMPLTLPYWEGPVQFFGSHQGFGYLELTGY
ncbi:lipocalin-like domain-containing protein [Paraferrimonas sedimenticola]|uniref:Carotenoid 1,2-hydratase n=1 Tax=Paraferrimonas sedimenticola TaxID=375674 RepID=A0AA37W0U0_9GAMM|nr:lipocalin-like domain-containing protein [Paraferrimonas sedimenticola]GLP95532.1 carotenoid 1,2-hydratase [Paraferrimonas sedimenticola]